MPRIVLLRAGQTDNYRVRPILDMVIDALRKAEETSQWPIPK